jgi:hypothetical protein
MIEGLQLYGIYFGQKQCSKIKITVGHQFRLVLAQVSVITVRNFA